MKYNNRNNKQLFYEVVNNESTKGTIVFLNGVMASTSSWTHQVKVFKESGYKIILHDFLGQLKSNKFEGLYSFEKHALDLHELLESLKEEKVHLIGTSYGGEVAMKFGMMYPSLVLSMSLIDSVSELDEHLINSVKDWIKLAKTYNGEEFFNGMMPTIYGKTYIQNNLDFMSKRAKAMNGVPKDYFDGQIGLYQTFIDDVTMTKDLHKITCPTLIICGEEDTLKPPKFSEIMHKGIKHSTYVTIPDCGHVTIFEKPDKLNKLLIEFVKKQ